MKNMFKMNKKGFTLVELLAVIVILALLIIITANTVLPMMKNTEDSGMKIYAEKMMQNALTMLESDKILSDVTYPKVYKISSELTDGKDDYVGCVQITSTTDGIKYEIRMYDFKNARFLKSNSPMLAKDLEDATQYAVSPYKGNLTKTNGVSIIETTNCSSSNFANLDDDIATP